MSDRTTRTIVIDPQRPDASVLRLAADTIRRGGLVAFPTETVYGLGANALDRDAVAKIFAAKGRPAINPVIVHVSDQQMLRHVVTDWPANAQHLADRFWPGPLTLVLPRTNSIPDIVSAGGPTVAVRMPAHLVALGLIREAGLPLAAPSANRSSELSPTRAEHVEAALGGRIDLILDGGPTPNGIESTVVDLTTSPATLLRPGPISVDELRQVIGWVQMRAAVSSAPLPSPGLLPRHYAPRTPLHLFCDRASLTEAFAKRQPVDCVARVLFGPAEDDDTIAMPTSVNEYASQMYATLHTLDKQGYSRIFLEMPPDTPEWVAVRDRLTRATGGASLKVR